MCTQLTSFFFQVFAIVSMYPVSFGFEEWIYRFVQDSFGQIWPKERNLTGRDSYTRIEPTSSTLQSCDWTNQTVVSTFRHQHTETRLKLPDSFPKESGTRETSGYAVHKLRTWGPGAGSQFLPLHKTRKFLSLFTRCMNQNKTHC